MLAAYLSGGDNLQRGISGELRELGRKGLSKAGPERCRLRIPTHNAERQYGDLFCAGSLANILPTMRSNSEGDFGFNSRKGGWSWCRMRSLVSRKLLARKGLLPAIAS